MAKKEPAGLVEPIDPVATPDDWRADGLRGACARLHVSLPWFESLIADADAAIVEVMQFGPVQPTAIAVEDRRALVQALRLAERAYKLHESIREKSGERDRVAPEPGSSEVSWSRTGRELLEARIDILWWLGHVYAKAPDALRALHDRKARAKGAGEANKARAVFSDLQELLDEMNGKVLAGTEPTAAINSLALRHDCTRTTVRNSLKNADRAGVSLAPALEAWFAKKRKTKTG